MFKFTGYLVNKHFEPTEAESPVDVYRNWKSDDDPPLRNLRCWVQSKAPDSSTVWVEIVLPIPGFFKRIQSLFFEDGDEISVEFRIKGTPSPNSTPNPSPEKGNDSEADSCSTIETLQTFEVASFSTMGLDENTRSTPKGGSSGCSIPSGEKEVDSSLLVNDKDPFTMEDVEEIEDPIYMRFKKARRRNGDEEHFDVLCMSLDSFERYLRVEGEKGKNLLDLELKRVMCKDGKERNFAITMQVWTRSILRLSRRMRNSFRDYLECLILREEELQELMKSQRELYQRVLYWVSDMLDYKNSQGRLDMPTCDGVTPFMTPFYFSKEEAQSLGCLRMPNTSTLHTTIEIMLEEKTSGGALEICTSHDLAPVLALAFKIKKGFHSNKNFNKDKKGWIKKREKEMMYK